MTSKNFNIEDIKKMAKDISESSVIPYEDLPRYDLFLSQVTDYLNDKFKGEKYTNNIVQNYIKNEVISKPEDGRKRGYTKNHLAQLLLLSHMRPILTTEEIKKVFRLAFNEINDREDDIISWEMAYKTFSNIQQENYDRFLSKDYFDEVEFKKMSDETGLSGKEEERMMVFIVVMNLIAEASVIKNIAKNIIDEYFEDK
ncbi:hypothetical protein DUF1836 [Clostridium pasteurianum DSM 525 = ATCC 6013]|uniref:DUF1836 domain-containing protein n=1 Tax=Clostridium pasteurianum DSM 525 = ATCC 6013 TaxID=1262449 RepID=A0A0H3IXP5_CLOPA|nr:hypothetical protein DUF1836 [Clostridium pasteurianum DSM 525 = ATCC 6013]AJA50229.1 hypothetical protein DUF1836 [Clostridium pasteurianum DSM 525 = ATCC 6013]ELP60825.1 hypothetical protein F502_00150 [Clostridium pasteurianum DSM 525 = ATCC 6013]KRU13759.1 protein of unknown function DUF1836 [Clostridium pasteurianum DSM 525 = ATCC 6013]